MANLLILAGPGGEFALAEGRRLANVVGATVYALVAGPPMESAAIETLARDLGSAGADRILLCGDARLASPAPGGALIPLLELLHAKLRPVLLLFPASAPGTSLAKALATRLKYSCHENASIEIDAASAGPDAATPSIVNLRASECLPLEGGPQPRPMIAVLAPPASLQPPAASAALEAEVQTINYPI